MFNTGMAAPSLADIAAVTKTNNGYGDAYGLGNGAIWVVILLFALFGGSFGGFGYGGNAGGAGTQFTEAALQRGFDTQTVINKLDGISNGICSLGYDQLAQMNGLGNIIMRTGFDLQQTMNNNAITEMQENNALTRQIDSCCCDTRFGLSELKNTMTADTCEVTNAIRQAAQDIMQNSNANYRSLHDEQVALQMEQKNERIQEQAAKIAQLELAASQAQQNQYLVNTLRPCPEPAYLTCNPFTGTINPYGIPWGNRNGYGWGNDCCNTGCNNNGGCCN